jgi:hypothetical protein
MTPRTQPAVEAVEQLIDAANQTPAAQTSEPHTAAGRRLHARIFGLSDRMPDGAELDNLILAIEAEAASPAAAPAGLYAQLVEARKAIESEIAMASDPEGKDQFEQGALAAYHFALSVLPDAVYAEGEPR